MDFPILIDLSTTFARINIKCNQRIAYFSTSIIWTIICVCFILNFKFFFCNNFYNNKYSILEVNVDSVGDGYKSLPTIKVVGDAVVPAILTAELLPIDKYVTFLTSFTCDANNVPQVQT